MIGLPAGTRIWIAAGVTDLRRGFERELVGSEFTDVRLNKRAYPLGRLLRLGARLAVRGFVGAAVLRSRLVTVPACERTLTVPGPSASRFQSGLKVWASPLPTEAAGLANDMGLPRRSNVESSKVYLAGCPSWRYVKVSSSGSNVRLNPVPAEAVVLSVAVRGSFDLEPVPTRVIVAALL